jgi:hypothetical protein
MGSSYVDAAGRHAREIAFRNVQDAVFAFTPRNTTLRLSGLPVPDDAEFLIPHSYHGKTAADGAKVAWVTNTLFFDARPPLVYEPDPTELLRLNVVDDSTVICHGPFAPALPRTPWMWTKSPVDHECVAVVITIGVAFVAAVTASGELPSA